LLDDELGLLLALAIGDRELDVLRADPLLERQRRTATVVSRVRPVARENCHELVLARSDVADVEPLDAALDEGLSFARRVEVARDVLFIELDLDGVQRKELAHVHRYENRDLRVRREKQLLLEQEQIPVQVEHLLLQVLHVLVERTELRARVTARPRSEEHTSELQSRENLVCRL